MSAPPYLLVDSDSDVEDIQYNQITGELISSSSLPSQIPSIVNSNSSDILVGPSISVTGRDINLVSAPQPTNVAQDIDIIFENNLSSQLATSRRSNRRPAPTQHYSPSNFEPQAQPPKRKKSNFLEPEEHVPPTISSSPPPKKSKQPLNSVATSLKRPSAAPVAPSSKKKPTPRRIQSPASNKSKSKSQSRSKEFPRLSSSLLTKIPSSSTSGSSSSTPSHSASSSDNDYRTLDSVGFLSYLLL
jgi:hypothetical protein